VLDTHAGIGLYDLEDPRAQKTHEADQGILSLLASPALPELAAYYAVLKKLNPLWTGSGCENFRVYPGSPLFAFHLLREQDRLLACELHPEDAETLRVQAPADKRFQIHSRNGYEALGAFLPPPEKRGLVLIDPPYESTDEFDVLAARLGETYRRWPTGTYMVWYPVKDRPAIWKFLQALELLGIPKVLRAEFIYDPSTRTDCLSGSGIVLINPPWKLDEELRAVFPTLHQAMKTGHAESIVTWIAEG
jgi:23S rRNA (adenine2030-N6)-methyltransferase